MQKFLSPNSYSSLYFVIQ